MLAVLALLLALQEPPFRVPEGWTAELAAGPPLVERPIMASFDDRGRLYVSDSAGVNLKGAELLKDPPHRIRRLEDADGDGRFDRSVVFADKLVFPQGLLWHDGAVYTVSPPGLWKLVDADGDGVAETRSELLTGFANTGVADDAHGCCLGPDGKLYFLPGRMAHRIRYPDGTPVKQATGPWLMRIDFDGGNAEIVSGAQGNPVEVDWFPEGDFFVSGTFWAPESYGGGLRDCVVHGVEGGEYAVRDRVYQDRIRTGDFLPPLIPQAATAPSGLCVGKADGPLRGSLLVTYFNTHRVQRHVLERDGATFRARTEEFVTSEHADFHPTDVLEDADGSVLVVDTGGWFRIGCPTSQIAKPQVLGGVWRLRRKDAPKLADPRGLALDWTKPLDHLADARWSVRERAVAELAKRPDPALAGHASLDALWALTRIGTPEARAAVRVALGDGDARRRQVAATSAGLHRDAEALDALMRLVRSDVAPVRREAATALGRIGRKEAVPALLDALRAGADRFLEHALIYALVRIADRDALVAALPDPSPAVRRAALIAADQIPESPLAAPHLTPLLDPADPELQKAALAVITKRGWTAEVVGVAREQLAAKAPDSELLRSLLAGFSKDPVVQDLCARALRSDATSTEARLLVLEAVARADRPPATWLAEARWSLGHADGRVVRQAVAALRASGTADFDLALLALAREEARPAELRIEALGAVAPRLPRLEGELFRFLLSQLDPEKPPLIRLSAAEALGRATLDDAQLGPLSKVLETAGPLELPRLIGLYAKSVNASVGRRLLAALDASPGSASLSAESLRRALARQPDDVRRRAEPLLKRLSADLEAMKARLEELRPLLAGGDAVRGRDVFLGRKAGCTACHTVAGQGGRVGPDLSKIGSIRQGADLLEAVVYPSASFARGFEPFVVRTAAGAVIDGVIVRETADEIVVFTPERVEKRVPRAQVEAVKESRVSIMPQGLDAQLGREELRDLIAYLASLR